MGFIDSDTHVIECEHTWDFFDPGERDLRPLVHDGLLATEDILIEWPGPLTRRNLSEIFPAGSVDLEDPAARVRWLDDLGADVGVIFPTFWLATRISSPMIEAAMS